MYSSLWKSSRFLQLLRPAEFSHPCYTLSELVQENFSFLTNITSRAKVLPLTRRFVFLVFFFLSVLVCYLTRVRGWTVWTLPRYRHVPGGLLHHLHDCALRLCHLHQWSAGCRGSLLYPLHICTLTWCPCGKAAWFGGNHHRTSFWEGWMVDKYHSD